MKTYLKELKDILKTGFKKKSRTGVDTIAKFGKLKRFDLTNNKIPVLTTKQVYLRSLTHELIWFISGSTRLKYLKEHGIKIWDSWVKPETAKWDYEDGLVDGDIGEGSYGYMWRGIEDSRVIDTDKVEDYLKKGFEVVMSDGSKTTVTRRIDQLKMAIDLLRNDPDSRRIIISSFENRMVDFAALIACHCYVQFFSRELTLEERLEHYRLNESKYPGQVLTSADYPIVSADGVDLKFTNGLDRIGVPKRALKMMLLMRSNDVPVGKPFNLTQYALLAHKVAHVTGHVAEEFIFVNADYHVYVDQIELVKEQIERKPFEQTVTVKLNPDVKEIDDFTFEDVTIVGYEQFHPAIKYPVAV